MIRIDNLSFSYPAAVRPVFTEFSLDIEHSSLVVIAGPDGSGKTTLGKLIGGLLEPNSGSINSSETPSPLDTGYLGGDPYDSLVGISVEEDVAFGLENLGLTRSEMKQRLDQALQWTELSGAEKRLTHTLSGGEQQKLALAGILAMGTRVMILDEALAMLDRPSRESIRSLLASLRDDLGITVVEISNRIEDILTADRIIFLSQGSVLYDGIPRDFLARPLGTRWSAGCGGVGALAGELFRRGILPAYPRDRSELVAFLLSNITE